VQACSPADFLTRNLNRTSLELSSFDAFWEAYLPSRMGTRADCFPFLSASAGRWAEYTAHYVPQSEILRCALLVLSTSQVGKARQDKDLLRRGLELYGQALSKLGKVLKTPGGQTHFDVLNSCRLLALFEV
jgi:hypothetical protein